MDNEKSLGQSKLEEAILFCEREYYGNFQETEGEIVYSARHQRKMRALRYGTSRAGGFGKKIAVILIAATLLCGSAIAVSSVQVPAIAQYFTNIRERFTEILFHKRDISEAPSRIETHYAPSYIPEGYAIQSCFEAQTNHSTIWKNESGDMIVFNQMTLDIKSTFDHEQTQAESFSVGNICGFVISKKGKICHYWNTKDYSFSLITEQALSEETRAAIIASITAAK